ncbi:sensor histidine kinase [Nocardia sp. IFM 10818]
MEPEEHSRLRAAISAHAGPIVADYVRRLEEIDSPLVRPEVIDAVVAQAHSILWSLAEDRSSEAAELSRAIGKRRAADGVRPADSMRAAALLFEAALPVAYRVVTAAGALDEFVDVVTELHDAIYERVVVAAVAYMDMLLDQVHESHQLERRRIARELHDQVAHTMAVGLQQFDLRSIDQRRRDDVSAEQRLTALRESMVEALNIVRELAGDLRRSPTRGGLEIALHRYAEMVAVKGVDIHLDIEGDLESISLEIRDELYFVVREAIRNAAVHSRSARILARISVSDDVFEAVVEDFGEGFDLENRTNGERGSGGGLTSMRERMEILGGTLMIVSSPGSGARVTAHVRL